MPRSKARARKFKTRARQSEPQAQARGCLLEERSFAQISARLRLGLGCVRLRLSLVCGALLLAACDRATPTTAAARDAAASPKQVVQRLIDAHKTTSYASIESLCVPERVSEITGTLTAIDEFLTANDALCDFVRDHISGGVARVIDQSDMASNLDIFSRYAEVVDERIDRDSALVTYTVDGRLPVRETKLVRIEGTWRYDPGDGYDAQIPAAFRRMAEGLRMVHDDLRNGRTPPEVRDDAEKLIEEVRLRMLPGVQMLPHGKGGG
jgi:hypothetical protein